MKLITLAILALSTNPLFAQEDGAFLDGKYSHLIHPKISKISNKSFPKSDTIAVIERQSSVKSQGARGTCSIFSATAYLEGQLIANKKFESSLDLSEEWLELTAIRGKTSDGSSAPTNFNAIFSYGMPNENTMPYIGENWVEVYNPLKESRCGHLTEASANKACLITHRDPQLLKMTDSQIISTLKDEEFMASRNEANSLKAKYLKPINSNYYIYDTNEVKEILTQGKPVILEVDFYYGAWNHREADEFGIGRDLSLWSKGVVTSPEPGSLDVQESQKHPAGHSILVVGYDDNKIVKKTQKMADGTTKTFTYKGVYYFKNSWGTQKFGVDFEIDGKKYPGYGMMVQKYAHEEGSFFQLPL